MSCSGPEGPSERTGPRPIGHDRQVIEGRTIRLPPDGGISPKSSAKWSKNLPTVTPPIRRKVLKKIRERARPAPAAPTPDDLAEAEMASPLPEATHYGADSSIEGRSVVARSEYPMGVESDRNGHSCSLRRRKVGHEVVGTFYSDQVTRRGFIWFVVRMDPHDDRHLLV